jgi:putative ABC transport system permease protein
MTMAGILYASFRRRAEGFYSLVATLAVNTFVIAIILSIAFSRDPDSLAAKAGIRNFVIVCAFVTAVCSAVFSNLIAIWILDGRRRELSTWLLVGMRRRTAFLIIASEFLIAFALADVLAIGIAIALNRFIALILGFVTYEGRAADMPISMDVIAVAVAVSVAQAAAVSIRIFASVRRSSIAELFSRTSERVISRKSMRLRALAGTSLICSGYACAGLSDARSAAFMLLPILLSVVIGTFLFMEWFVPWYSSARRSRKSSDAAVLVASSGASLRTSRDAHVLALAAILVAASATAGGALFATASNADIQAMRSCPNGAELSGLRGAAFDAAVERIDAAFARNCAEVPRRRVVSSLPVRLSVVAGRVPRNLDAEAIRRSDWISLITESGRTLPALRADRDFLLTAGDDPAGSAMEGGTLLEVGSGEEIVKGRVDIVQESYVLSSGNASCVIVVADETWQRLSAAPKAAPLRRTAVWNGGEGQTQNWGTVMRSAVQSEVDVGVLVQSEEKALFARESGVMRFLGAFLAGVFLFASVATMAFKFYEDARNDRGRYRLLCSIGMNSRIGRRASTIQMLDAYMPPVFLGIIHTAFAMRMLGTITRFDVAVPAARVAFVTVTLFALSSIGVAGRYQRAVSFR